MLGFGSGLVLLHAAATSGKVMTLAIDPGVGKNIGFFVATFRIN
ncbi:hypothetical protein [[Mycoplasma] phocidae]|nr:hypothetical protein [[Mycoplasma] phocae]